MINLDDIRSFFRGYLGLNEPLNKYTSFKIGGPADYYFEPADKDDVVQLITYFHRHDVSFTIIGVGSNLLVSDEGIRQPVINLEAGLHRVIIDGERIVAEAGVRMTKFVDACIHEGRKGVEMLAGIPGTIGGAVMMNAGAYGGEISDYLVDVEVVRAGAVVKVKKSDAGFAYRTSGFRNDVVLGASFNLPHGSKEESAMLRRELLMKRNQSQPLHLPNSGSVFKNPAGSHAAKLIEEAGLKGTRCGMAQISEKHANFIVNTGAASARDVVELMKLARTTVLKRFGIKLEPEVRLIGFSKDIQEELYS